MDPNHAWETAVMISKKLQRRNEVDFYQDERDFLDDVDAMAQAVEDLRWWLSMGGFPPKAFSVNHSDEVSE